MARRLCIVPRWGAGPDDEWYPWVRNQPWVQSAFPDIISPAVDVPDAPTIEAWVKSLTEHCHGDVSETYFIGHSVGCQAIVRYLVNLSEGTVIPGVVFTAGWWHIDEPWDTIRPWMYTPDHLDAEKMRKSCRRSIVLISDNDPFTADWQSTRKDWEDHLHANVRVYPGLKHFNQEEAPMVVEALTDLIR